MAAAQPLPGLPAGAEVVAQVEVTAVSVELPSLETRIGWFDDWEEKTAESQKLARRDRAYYDNEQWTEEELQELENRHQPALVKNRIARKVNFILGEEIKKRVDPVARPRTPQHEDAARAATDALRYVSDEQRFDQVRSQVLKNILIEGFGGALKEIEQTEDGKCKHKLTHVQWDRLFYDPHSRAPDFSDALYIGVVCWMDLADAVLEYPEAAEALKSAVKKSPSTSETTEDTPRKCWGDNKRQRVKIAEMFFRIGQDWYRSVFTSGADIEQPAPTWLKDESGRHSVCPLVMESCYVDQEGNRYGVVRQLISPQDEINKRSSKALHLLSVNGVIAEKNAIDDPTKFQIELAKPDGFYGGLRPGALKDQSIQVREGMQLAQGQLQLLQEAKADIDSIGPSSSTVPDLPASASGRAVLARQQSAEQELGTIFDQLRDWSHAVYRLDWLAVRACWTEEQWLRVTDDQELNGYRFTALNRRMTRAERFKELLSGKTRVQPNQALAIAAGEWAPVVAAQVEEQVQSYQAMAEQAQAMGAQPPPMPPPEEIIAANPIMAEQITVNQVDQMLVDIVLDDSPHSVVLADEQYEKLAEVLPTALPLVPPPVQLVLVRSLFQSSALPERKKILDALDQAAQEPAPDPAAQQVQQLQAALAQAQLEVAQTKAALQAAQTQKTQAEAAAIPIQTQADAQAKQAQAMSAAAEAQAKPEQVKADVLHKQMQSLVHAANAGAKSGMTPVVGVPQQWRGMGQ